MRKSIKTVLLLSACLGGYMAVAAEATENNDQIDQAIYQCERGVVVPVTYLNTSNGGSYAVVQVEGQQVAMNIEVSASGARYLSIDEKRPYSWHTKGSSATLFWQPADEPDNSVILLSECSTGAEMFAENTQ
ncbi:MAG: lysozyme inhibitor [Gammaproteobacteria bacterium]|nr:lysozyme inhibitor [Gammaproteobacteria bacterium]